MAAAWIPLYTESGHTKRWAAKSEIGRGCVKTCESRFCAVVICVERSTNTSTRMMSPGYTSRAQFHFAAFRRVCVFTQPRPIAVIRVWDQRRQRSGHIGGWRLRRSWCTIRRMPSRVLSPMRPGSTEVLSKITRDVRWPYRLPRLEYGRFGLNLSVPLPVPWTCDKASAACSSNATGLR